MDSIAEFDPTLPIDLDGSANPDLLTDVTFGSHLEYPDGLPMVVKSNTGRMSPVRARTMKEYDQQIADYQKENFNLKLRIYFLETRMQQKFGDEDIFKVNIDLRVEAETYKKELEEKQELLKKASETLDKLTVGFQTQLQDEVSKVRFEMEEKLVEAEQKAEVSEKELKEARNHLQVLEDEARQMTRDLEAAEEKEGKLADEIQLLRKDLDDKDRQNEDLQCQLQKSQAEVDSIRAEAEHSKADLIEQFEKLRTTVTRKDRDVEDVVDDQRQSLDKLKLKVDAGEQNLKRKESMIGRLEDLLRDKDKERKELEKKVKGMQKELDVLKDKQDKMKDALIGFTTLGREKDQQIEDLSGQLQEAQIDLDKAKRELQKLMIDKQKAIEHLSVELSDSEDRIVGLQGHMKEQQMEIERLVKTLGRKEGELAGFKEHLKTAQESLRQSEMAVEELQAQITQEKQQRDGWVQDLERKYQDLVAEKNQQLGGIQDEMAQLQAALRDREDKLEKANGMLLQTEDTINVLERDGREKEEDMKVALRSAQKAVEDALANQAVTVEEKDRTIRCLQSALDTKERALEELFQQAPKTDDAKVQHLQLKLREKDQLLQEILADQNEAADRRDEEAKNLRARLREKEAELDDVTEKHEKAIHNYREELEKLQLELRKKELEFLAKLREVMGMDSGAQNLNIKVGGDSNPEIQQLILEQLKELKQMNAALHGDKHIHIDLHQNQFPTHDRETADTDVRSPRAKSPPKVTRSVSASRIPVRKGSSTSGDPEGENQVLRKLLKESQAHIRDLENMVRSTEETVRVMAQKLKHYKALLKEHNIHYQHLSRSNSESNLGRASPCRELRRRCSSSEDMIMTSRRSVSPSPLSFRNQNFGSPLGDLHSLREENRKLKEKNDGYRRLIKVLQGRSPSPQSGDQSQDSDTGSQKSDIEDQDQGQGRVQEKIKQDQSKGQRRCLEMWCDEIGELLLDLSQGDQNGAVGGQTSSSTISRLRQGLKDIKHELASQPASTQDPVFVREPIKSPLSTNTAKLYRYSLPVQGTRMEEFNSSRPQQSPQSLNNVYAADLRPQQTQQKLEKSQGLNPSPGRKSLQNESPGRKPLQNVTSSVINATADSSMEQLRHRIPSGNTWDRGHSATGISDLDSFRSSCYHGKGFPGRSTLDFIGREPELDAQRKSHSPAESSSQSQSGNGSVPHPVHNSRSVPDKLFERTISQSFFEDESKGLSNTFMQLSNLDIDNMSIDDTDSDRSRSATPNLEVDKLKGRIKALENLNSTMREELNLYEKSARKAQGGMSDDTLQQHLAELRALRIKLEASLRQSGDIMGSINFNMQDEDKLLDQEATIRDLQQIIQNLRQQLTTQNSNVREKLTIIEEKERVIHETNVILKRLKEKDGSRESFVQQLNEKVKLLEAKIDQYKEMEESLHGTVNKLKTIIDEKQKRVSELESDIMTYKQLEEKQRGALSQLRKQLKGQAEKMTEITKCVQEKEEMIRRQTTQVDEQKHQIDELNMKLQRQSDVIEKHLRDGENYKHELDQKNEQIRRYEAMLKEQKQTIEGQQSVINEHKMRFDQQWTLITEQKQKLERQEKMLEDMNDLERSRSGHRDKVGELEAEVARKEAELSELMQKKEKMKTNMMKMLRELRKYQRELRITTEKLEEIKGLNSTLKVEMRVHEKLNMSSGALPEEMRQDIIHELLNEIKQLRIKMEQCIDVNTSLREKVEQLLAKQEEWKKRQGASDGKEQSPARSQGTDATDGQPSPERPRNLENSRGDVPGGRDSPYDKETLVTRFSGHFEERFNLLDSPDSTISTDSGNIEEADNSTGAGSLRNLTWPNLAQDKTDPSSANLTHDGTCPSSLHMSLSSRVSLGNKGQSFCVPGPIYQQKSAADTIHYRVTDSPQTVAGLTQMRVDSDLRTLFALGKIDDYEKLQKESSESLVVLSGVEARIRDRLKAFINASPSQSLEYSTLKQLSMSAQDLKICLNEVHSLIGCFWVSELPSPNERGEFVNQKLVTENGALQLKLVELQNKYEHLAMMVENANQRLHSTNQQKQQMEEKIYSSLKTTTDVVTQARRNFEDIVSQQGVPSQREGTNHRRKHSPAKHS